MVIVKLKGGLGNQMFQYAAARSLISNDNFLFYDLSFLEENRIGDQHFTAREFELSIFKNIRAKRADKAMLDYFHGQSFIKRALRFFLWNESKYINHSGNYFLELYPVPKKSQTYIEGYFQSEKYFKSIKSSLFAEFEFPPLDAKNDTVKNCMRMSVNSVSIHIRRGDYLNSQKINAVHGVLPLSYYQKAIDHLRYSYGSLDLFIFSEDVYWAKENFCGENIQFINENTGKQSWKDMALMTCCKHHIIANSSFSWWGAWLSANDGEVIAPRRWFNPKMVAFNIHDIIPENWTILDFE